MKTKLQINEYNFDGIVGPTHNYAGLSAGNLASMKNKNTVSHPKQAALEGLKKMKLIMDRGFKQAVLPPHNRPYIGFLKSLGWTGNREQILKKAWELSPALLASCYSASSMWTANAATVSPSADTKDQKVHFTPANLHSYLHRSLEAKQTHLILKKIFSHPDFFVHHPPLPSNHFFTDEGAANHNRLCSSYGETGLEVFVYGKQGGSTNDEKKLFMPRQSLEASKLIASHHQLTEKNTLLVMQNPEAVDAGVFHNDVICVADQNLILYHEQAFVDTKKTIQEIENKLTIKLLKIEVKKTELNLEEIVSSYLFNSQLLPLSDEQWILFAPSECEERKSVRQYLEFLTESSPIKEICFIPIRESMQNGGGPACLRLRIVLRAEEQECIHQGICLNEKLFQCLSEWVKKHYREELKPQDLLDPKLVEENERALDELTQILKLENIYEFQS